VTGLKIGRKVNSGNLNFGGATGFTAGCFDRLQDREQKQGFVLNNQVTVMHGVMDWPKQVRSCGVLGRCGRRKASSSIGRAAVSKTAGWGFDSLLACHTAGLF
jgi:hypothetical protein